jgi:hypothetical protein
VREGGLAMLVVTTSHSERDMMIIENMSHFMKVELLYSRERTVRQ